MDSCGTQEYAIFANSSGIWPRMLLARDFFNLGILSRVIIQVGRYNNVTAGIPLLDMRVSSPGAEWNTSS